MPTPPKPFPLYTDGTGVFFTTDGVNFTQLGGGAAGSIPLSELAHQADQTVVGNVAGSSASPVALTATQLTALINPATGSLPGAMSAAQFSALSGLQASKLPGACQVAYSDVIDFTTTGTYLVIPAIAARLVVDLIWFELKTTTGASVAPTYSMGTDGGVSNVEASQTVSTFASQAAETIITNGVLVLPRPVLDMTSSGLSIKVTNGATATAMTGRVLVLYMLLPV